MIDGLPWMDCPWWTTHSSFCMNCLIKFLHVYNSLSDTCWLQRRSHIAAMCESSPAMLSVSLIQTGEWNDLFRRYRRGVFSCSCHLDVGWVFSIIADMFANDLLYHVTYRQNVNMAGNSWPWTGDPISNVAKKLLGWLKDHTEDEPLNHGALVAVLLGWDRHWLLGSCPY